jgi:hypothetical protein
MSSAKLASTSQGQVVATATQPSSLAAPTPSSACHLDKLVLEKTSPGLLSGDVQLRAFLGTQHAL